MRFKQVALSFILQTPMYSQTCSGGDLEALLLLSYPLAYRQHAVSLQLTQPHLYYL